MVILLESVEIDVAVHWQALCIVNRDIIFNFSQQLAHTYSQKQHYCSQKQHLANAIGLEKEFRDNAPCNLASVHY